MPAFLVSEESNLLPFSKLYLKSILQEENDMKFIEKKEGVEAVIHFSEILSKLMKESERLCKYHASDLFISWEGVLEEMRSPDFFDTFPKTFFFGFRECGVDSEGFLRARLTDPRMYGVRPYLSIWTLQFKMAAEDSFSAELKQLTEEEIQDLQIHYMEEKEG